MMVPPPSARSTLPTQGEHLKRVPASRPEGRLLQDGSTRDLALSGWDFSLPSELEAGEPPEARGLARDQVRLMVSRRSQPGLHHSGFRSLPDFLVEGDLLVVNTSATLNAALPAVRKGGQRLVLHLSTHLPAGDWTVELRQPESSIAAYGATGPLPEDLRATIRPGEVLTLPGDAQAILQKPYRMPLPNPGSLGGGRLWQASLLTPLYFGRPLSIHAYLNRYGSPIRYRYVRREWPLHYYQTIFARHPGSAEMPSAGRAFSHALVAQLARRGVAVAPLVLHTGVASPEAHEPPYEEYYHVPERTAQMVNAARARGSRVIAAGTTVVRALESAAQPPAGVSGEASSRVVQAAEGWTDLVVTPRRGLYVVDALLTGLHEPNSTHLAMLEAFADRGLLQDAYKAAQEQGYLWHEFGDLHLILP